MFVRMVARVGDDRALFVLAIAGHSRSCELQREQEHEEQDDKTHGAIVEVGQLRSRGAAAFRIRTARGPGDEFGRGRCDLHGLEGADGGAADIAEGQPTGQVPQRHQGQAEQLADCLTYVALAQCLTQHQGMCLQVGTTWAASSNCQR